MINRHDEQGARVGLPPVRRNDDRRRRVAIDHVVRSADRRRASRQQDTERTDVPRRFMRPPHPRIIYRGRDGGAAGQSGGVPERRPAQAARRAALDAVNVRRNFRRALKLVPTINEPGDWTPREMRHSFVSLLSEHGLPIEEISKLIDHVERPSPILCSTTNCGRAVQTGAPASAARQANREDRTVGGMGDSVPQQMTPDIGEVAQQPSRVIQRGWA